MKQTENSLKMVSIYLMKVYFQKRYISRFSKQLTADYSAHNLEDVARNAATVEVTEKQMVIMRFELHSLCNNNVLPDAHGRLLDVGQQYCTLGCFLGNNLKLYIGHGKTIQYDHQSKSCVQHCR